MTSGHLFFNCVYRVQSIVWRLKAVTRVSCLLDWKQFTVRARAFTADSNFPCAPEARAFTAGSNFLCAPSARAFTADSNFLCAPVARVFTTDSNFLCAPTARVFTTDSNFLCTTAAHAFTADCKFLCTAVTSKTCFKLVFSRYLCAQNSFNHVNRRFQTRNFSTSSHQNYKNKRAKKPKHGGSTMTERSETASVSLAAQMLSGVRDDSELKKPANNSVNDGFNKRDEALLHDLLDVRHLVEGTITNVVTDTDTTFDEEIHAEGKHLNTKSCSENKSNADDYLEELSLDHSLATSTVPIPRREGRMMTIYGSPNGSVPVSKVPCHGCGALLHCRDPGVPGYLPSQKFLLLTSDDLKAVTCQRCYLLKRYNIAIDATVGPAEYEIIISKIKKSQSLIIVLIDLTDMPSSLYGGVWKLFGESSHPIYIVGNKVDLIPKDEVGYLKRVKDSMLQHCRENGLMKEGWIKHVALISAKTGYGVEELITQLLNDWKLKGQYLHN